MTFKLRPGGSEGFQDEEWSGRDTGGEVQSGKSLVVINEGEHSMKDKKESEHALASVAQLVSSHPGQ